MVKEDIICKEISVIDLVYNHTITLECELKVVSKMPSMKRPAAVFARAADITLKTSSIGVNVVPNVKLMISQREPKACDAILQAVGQRSQLIPEVLDTINETWTMIPGEEFVLSLSNDKDVRAE